MGSAWRSPEGSIFLLLGPNGAGKTTLLRILMGLIEPTAGAAYVLGSPAWPQPAEVISAVGYVGDRCEPPAWASLALLEDLQAGASPTFDKALFRELCRRRELPPNRPIRFVEQGPATVDLGQASLWRAGRRLILLDEPADGLDPSARRALYDALRDHVNQHEATAIVTTHVIADVERIGDEVAIIDRGRLLFTLRWKTCATACGRWKSKWRRTAAILWRLDRRFWAARSRELPPSSGSSKMG